MTQAQRDVRRKLAVLRHAEVSANVSLTCRRFGVSRDTYYEWKRAYATRGEEGLVGQRRGPRHPHPNRMPAELEKRVLELRTLGLGPQRISWYLSRYDGKRLSSSGVYYALRRNGLNRLPQYQSKRCVGTWRRYEKEVPGHQVQVDVKFVDVVTRSGKHLRRFQYTAIDDATRIRALRLYPRHTQASAINFLDYVVDKFPFRIRQVRTDRGHEFQALFHWHVEDLGIEHVYIRPRTPRLNGKVERSHKTDKVEFYQLLEYKDDVDLEAKLAEWEDFYNFQRPHGAHRGKTPYEILRERLTSQAKLCQASA